MELVGQFNTIDVAVAKIIFNPGCIGHLSAHLTGDQASGHAFAQAIDSGCHAGWSATNDDDVVNLV